MERKIETRMDIYWRLEATWRELGDWRSKIMAEKLRTESILGRAWGP